jgi:hypothetical protein
MEQKLLYALRYLGMGAETQVPVGDHHVDMIVFGRSSSNEVIIECDSADFHHNLIDEFRDDELVDIARLPIAHIPGNEIAESSERCALSIAERWFPKLMERQCYPAALERAGSANHGLQLDGTLRSDLVGIVRPTTGDPYPSQSDHIHRGYLRYIVGNTSECQFLNSKEQKRVEEWKEEFAKLGVSQRKFSLEELARFYILLFYREPDLSCELRRLDNFLEYRRKLIEIREANEAEIPE